MSRAKDNAQAAYRWLKVEHIATELECSNAHVLNLIADNTLPATDIARRRPGAKKHRPEYRVRPEDFEAFLGERQAKAS